MKNKLKILFRTMVTKSHRTGLVLFLALLGFVHSEASVAQDFLVMGWSGASTSNQLVLNGSTVVTAKWSGWYLQNGSHSYGNTNYICGYYGGSYYRNWFAFDIPSGLGTISSAVLKVRQAGSIPASGYAVIQFFNVTYNYATVSADNGAGNGVAVFNDLGDGAFYGNGTIDGSLSQDNVVSIPLNSAAKGAIQTVAGSTFILGGRCDTYLAHDPPDATTNSATNVAGTTATLNGSVIANGVSTTVTFMYGTSSGNLTNSVNATPSPVTGSSATAVSASISGLTAGATYYFQVKAVNTDPATVYGLEKSFTTTNAQPPADPTSVTPSTITICNGSGTTLTAGGAAGTVNWYSGSCGGTYVGQGNSITVYPSATTTYYAKNFNNGLYSAGCASATMTVNNPATVPSGALCSITTATTGDLSWGTSTGTGAITYYWVVGTTPTVLYGSGVASGSTTQTSVTATGLTPSTGYYLRVYASTDAPCGNSGYQTSGMFTTIPAAPVANAATLLRANSFKANWSASAGAINYFIDLSTDINFGTFVTGYQNKSVGNVQELSISGLNRATNYYYRVRAYNTGGNSLASNTISLTTLPLNNFLIEKVGGGSIGDQLAGQPFSIMITARDAQNTTVTDFNSSVTITSNSVLTAGGTTASFTSGVLSSHSIKLTQSGTLKTVTATSGSVVNTSNTFTVTPAGINHFALVVNGTVTAGVPFTVTATVFDDFGNIKTNYDGTNNVSWTTTAITSANGTARIIPANGNQTFTQGVATISGFTFFNSDQLPLPTITVTDGPTASPGTTDAITVKNNILDNFKVIAGTSQAGGVPFDVTVTARDVYWNICKDYTGSIRFKSSDDTKVNFPAGLQSMAGTNGIKTYANGITINSTGAYWLRAADAVSAFKSGEQQNILIGPGVFSPLATKSTLTVDYSTRIAGEYVTVTLTPRDAQGNLLYACRNISVKLNGSTDNLLTISGSNVLRPIIVTNLGNGSYTAVVRVTTVGNNIISARFNDTGVDFEQTRTITVAPATAAYLSITGSGAQIAGTSQPVTITAYDAFDNVAIGYTGSKDLTLSGANVSASPSTSPTLAGTAFGTPTTLTFTAGVSSGSLYLYKVETAIVSASDGVINSAGHTLTVNVSPATANYLSITGNGTQVAGVSQTITITAYDSYNNIATGYTGSHSLIFSGANTALTTPTATYPTVAGTAFDASASLSFTAGVANGTMSLFKVETATVTTTDGTISSSGHELSVAVTSASANYLALTGTDSQIAGAGQTVTVTAYDVYNNIATGYAGSKALTFSGANSSPSPASAPTVSSTSFGTSTSLTFTSGVATGNMILYKVETAQVTATDGTINSSLYKLSVTVTHATANYLAITGSSTQVAGTSQTITLTAYDHFNNIATGYAGDKSLTFSGANISPDPSTSPTVNTTDFGSATPITFVSGIASAGMTLYKTETASISSNDGTINSGTYILSVTVTPAPATYFIITGNSSQIAGTSQTVTVTAYDFNNNVARTYTGSKTLTFTGAGSSPAPVNNPVAGGTAFGSPRTVVFSSGVATLPVTLYKTETAHVTATDGSINSDQHKLDVLVNPALLKDFVVSGVPSPHDLGTWQGVEVEARDTYNNRKTNYLGSITFSNTDIDAINPDDYQYTPADQGIHNFDNSVKFSASGNWWLTAMDLNEPAKYGYQADIIVRRPLTILASNQSKSYGSDFTFNGTEFRVIGTLAPGEAITQVVLTSDGTSSSADAGDYDITPDLATGTGGFNEENYNITYSTEGKLTVNPAVLTITANSDQSKVYGETDPSLTYTVSGYQNEQDASILDGTLSRLAGENAGTYPIGQGNLTAGDNYSITYVAADFEIGTLPVDVTVTPGQSKTFGDNNPEYTYFSSPAAGTVLANLEVVSFTGTLDKTEGEDAGTYGLGQGSLTNSNYSITFHSASFVINPLPVTVTANSGQSKKYGDLDPEFTFTSSPAEASVLANGAVVSFTGVLSRVPGENVSEYLIGQGSLANTNFAITYAADNFTITQLPLTITPDAGQKKVYGDVDPVYTYKTEPAIASILPNSEIISLTGTMERSVGESAGSYAFSQGSLENSNYLIAFSADNFTIAPLPVTVTPAPDQKKTYGDAEPMLTFTSTPAVGTSLANSQVISFTGKIERAQGEAAASYALSLGTLANSNYAITFTPENFKINPLEVTVTADAGLTKVYGEGDPTFTFISEPALATSLANGATITFTGRLSRIAGEDAGRYAETIGDLNNANYSINFVKSDFTISKATLKVSAENKSKTYGDTNPALTLSYSGFKGSDDSRTIDQIPAISTAALQYSVPGTYPIVLTGGTDNNYLLDESNATLTVAKANLTINADSKSRDYLTVNPALTYTISGFLNGENSSVLDELPVIQTSAVQNSNAGVYPIVLSGGNDNCYSYSYLPGKLTIDKIPQVITFTDVPEKMLMLDVYSMAATSTSGLPVSFESMDNQYATVSGNQCTGVSRGTAQIRAYSNGDQNYLSADVMAQIEISTTHKDILHLFTPNNDGFNDTWEIPDIASYGVCNVRIFNRWGKLVYANANYDNLWDGTSSGVALPDGAYYFIIKTQNSGTISGTVNIVR